MPNMGFCYGHFGMERHESVRDSRGLNNKKPFVECVTYVCIILDVVICCDKGREK